MDELVTILLAVIGSGVLNTLLNAWLSSKKKETAVERSMRLVMKNALRSLCEKYIAQGWIYSDELDDLIVMHDCYHTTLKGNGYLDNLMSRVEKLEVRGIGVR